jgi:hypothetical protein
VFPFGDFSASILKMCFSYVVEPQEHEKNNFKFFWLSNGSNEASEGRNFGKLLKIIEEV